jgi:hypothetical protein
MDKDKAVHTFQVIRHRGQPNRLQLPDGTWVYKEDKVFVPEWGRFIPCPPYSDEFIYTLPKKYPGSAIMCSCGSFAVVSGYSAYKDDASQQGLLVVCHLHATTGRHSNTGARWV